MPVSMHAALYKTILHTLLLLLVLAQIYMHDPEKQGGYRCYRIHIISLTYAHGCRLCPIRSPPTVVIANGVRPAL